MISNNLKLIFYFLENSINYLKDNTIQVKSKKFYLSSMHVTESDKVNFLNYF